MQLKIALLFIRNQIIFNFMAQRNKNTLKGYFNTGDKPTEQQFEDLIDSFHNKVDEPIVQSVNGQTGNVTVLGQEPDAVGSMNFGVLKNYTTASSTTNIFHLKLPFRTDTDNKMFYLEATGYAYASGEIVDIVWVGYCYKNGAVGSKLLKTKTHVNRSTVITAGLYEGSDTHIYAWFKIPNTQHTTFRVNTMRVGNGTSMAAGSISLVLSPQVKL